MHTQTANGRTVAIAAPTLWARRPPETKTGHDLGKIRYLDGKHGLVAVRAMRRIKQALDPDRF